MLLCGKLAPDSLMRYAVGTPGESCRPEMAGQTPRLFSLVVGILTIAVVQTIV